MNQQQHDSIVRQQRTAWEKRFDRFSKDCARGMEKVLVDSIARPGVTYESRACLQKDFVFGSVSL